MVRVDIAKEREDGVVRQCRMCRESRQKKASKEEEAAQKKTHNSQDEEKRKRVKNPERLWILWMLYQDMRSTLIARESRWKRERERQMR